MFVYKIARALPIACKEDHRNAVTWKTRSLKTDILEILNKAASSVGAWRAYSPRIAVNVTETHKVKIIIISSVFLQNKPWNHVFSIERAHWHLQSHYKHNNNRIECTLLDFCFILFVCFVCVSSQCWNFIGLKHDAETYTKMYSHRHKCVPHTTQHPKVSNSISFSLIFLMFFFLLLFWFRCARCSLPMCRIQMIKLIRNSKYQKVKAYAGCFVVHLNAGLPPIFLFERYLTNEWTDVTVKHIDVRQRNVTQSSYCITQYWIISLLIFVCICMSRAIRIFRLKSIRLMNIYY